MVPYQDGVEGDAIEREAKERDGGQLRHLQGEERHLGDGQPRADLADAAAGAALPLHAAGVVAGMGSVARRARVLPAAAPSALAGALLDEQERGGPDGGAPHLEHDGAEMETEMSTRAAMMKSITFSITLAIIIIRGLPANYNN